MTRAYRETLEQARTRRINMLLGTDAVAVDRVAEATRLRGLYP